VMFANGPDVMFTEGGGCGSSPDSLVVTLTEGLHRH
jgi:hypothetical protein